MGTMNFFVGSLEDLSDALKQVAADERAARFDDQRTDFEGAAIEQLFDSMFGEAI